MLVIGTPEQTVTELVYSSQESELIVGQGYSPDNSTTHNSQSLTDKVCLPDTTTCINMPFSQKSAGIFPLAPGRTSLIKKMKKQGGLSKAVVSFAGDQVQFGNDTVFAGYESFTHSNKDQQWKLDYRGSKYDRKWLNSFVPFYERVWARVDTSQSMISVTPNEFDELLHHLTPIVDLTCNNNICTSPNKCEKLWVYMATFSIQLKMVIYTIPASGLTIDTADGCLIGVTSSGDNSETVLGTLFMKSYGTILDFEKNKVTFALTGEATARQKLAWPI